MEYDSKNNSFFVNFNISEIEELIAQLNSKDTLVKISDSNQHQRLDVTTNNSKIIKSANSLINNE